MNIEELRQIRSNIVQDTVALTSKAPKGPLMFNYLPSFLRYFFD